MGKKKAFKSKQKMTPEFMEFLRRKSHSHDGAIFDDIIKQLGLPPLPPRKKLIAQAIEAL